MVLAIFMEASYAMYNHGNQAGLNHLRQIWSAHHFYPVYWKAPIGRNSRCGVPST